MPSYNSPRLWTELKYASFYAAEYAWDMCNSTPVIFFGFEIFTNQNSELNPKSVAQQNIQNPLIPPTFGNVRHPVCAYNFKKFPNNTVSPQNASISNHYSFGKESKKV
eukprot:489639_1